MKTLAHSLGLGQDTALCRLLRACGIDEARITGGASDYDKFLALAEAMPLCAGHPLREALEDRLCRITGISAPLCPHDAHDFWTAWIDRYWYGDLSAPPPLPHVCPHCAPCEPARRLSASDLVHLPEPQTVSGENLGAWTRELEAALTACDAYSVCRLPADYAFVRPDPYHAGEVLRKQSDGGELTPRERDLLWTQALRVWGLDALRRGAELMLQGGSPAAVTALLAYLDSSRALPKLVWIPLDPAHAREVCGLYATVGTGVDLSACTTDEERETRLTAYAAAAPLGRGAVIEA